MSDSALPSVANAAPRASGILLHPTSLPGPFGAGTIGDEALRFVDFLVSAGQSFWQVLPLGPPVFGPSPYLAQSSFAGNPMLICPRELMRAGLLEKADVEGAPSGDERIDFTALWHYRQRLLRKAFAAFERQPHSDDRLREYRQSAGERIEDYALFAAIKRAHQGRPWTHFPEGLRRREPSALLNAKRALEEEIRFELFAQMLFDQQWQRVRKYANERGVALLGDVPIFAAHDSADVWATPDVFCLDENGEQPFIAGVPPDSFSEDGQRWGNALYRWDRLRERGYDWWIDRFAAALRQTDAVRLDHFIGFARYWEIPSSCPTARIGNWRPGPGADFFDKVQKALGRLPFVAEDLGVVGEDVISLRDRFELPGIRVLQMSFDVGEWAQPPVWTIPERSFVYTGTHDTDTLRGWFLDPKEAAKAERARRYVGSNEPAPVWELVRLAMSSPARVSMFPMQDILELGTEARMNLPATDVGNWEWRMKDDALNDALAAKLADMASVYGRDRSSAQRESSARVSASSTRV